ncbi:hypothetical protein BST61_g3969 [Cercospora zeina]
MLLACDRLGLDSLRQMEPFPHIYHAPTFPLCDINLVALSHSSWAAWRRWEWGQALLAPWQSSKSWSANPGSGLPFAQIHTGFAGDRHIASTTTVLAPLTADAKTAAATTESPAPPISRLAAAAGSSIKRKARPSRRRD